MSQDLDRKTESAENVLFVLNRYYATIERANGYYAGHNYWLQFFFTNEEFNALNKFQVACGCFTYRAPAELTSKISKLESCVERLNKEYAEDYDMPEFVYDLIREIRSNDTTS